nr:unnamed protein product [Callosobruchus chinensis]
MYVVCVLHLGRVAMKKKQNCKRNTPVPLKRKWKFAGKRN